MTSRKNLIAVIGLAMGAVFGMSGSFVADPTLTGILYEISSIGLIFALALLTIKYIKEDDDYRATGFLLFAIGEAAMSVGTASGEIAGQSAFAAGMAIYVPALLFISLPKGFPSWVRFTGIAATIPFAIAAATIFTGGQVLGSSPIAGAAYGLLVITIVGWCLSLLREGKVAQTSQAFA